MLHPSRVRLPLAGATAPVRRALFSVAVLALPLALTACGSSNPASSGLAFKAKYEPWRDQEERQCLASGAVQRTAFLQPQSALGGPSVCGALRPFRMSAAAGGRVRLDPPALLRCPMVPAVDRWITQVVQPEARRQFGVGVAGVTVAASYGCRPIGHKTGGKLSEHGHANAIDISRFVLENGRVITLKQGWNGDPRARAFLRNVHAGACRIFFTVLGPNYNRAH
ncbi:MAG: extensin family protein, partial [Pseudomonadota bacterium]